MYSLYSLYTIVICIIHSCTATNHERVALKNMVTWYAPFLSGGGYCSEAISFATYLVDRIDGNRFGAVQFAEQFNSQFYDGLPEEQSKPLQRALQIGNVIKTSKASGITICHSTPDIWVPSVFPGWDESAPCPSPHAIYKIGRTMYETDRVPQMWVERLNKMDEIWVPTQFHVETFTKCGVEQSKLVVVPEAVDVDFFDPAKFEPELFPGARHDDFKFLSVFKWEKRKGWDALLRAYFLEFSSKDNVMLCIKTSPFYDDGLSTFQERIVKFVNDELGIDEKDMARFTVIDQNVDGSLFPILYASADAFVLPHRGEGWGRPHAEAMAMGLPVLATNWSGNTAFMNEDNSYPIKVDSLSLVNPDAPKFIKDKDGKEIPNIDATQKWAEPSVDHLRQTMRHVSENHDEAIKKGYKARKFMKSKYSPQAVGEVVLEQLQRIEQKLSIQKDEL